MPNVRVRIQTPVLKQQQGQLADTSLRAILNEVRATVLLSDDMNHTMVGDKLRF